ncbi:MAG: tRNA preQ1(34) S-adenosylmethionine ribosyltransferase-isomerase QueA [Paludibacteraceae bacterium]|nr:tRNA preQ1(34) S-adenosylmethionine ribosyltransferase-isomerase QueA [Paludibacteraceae bacterium]
MKLSQFKFNLPTEQIAQYPSRFRDDSRLLVLHRKTGLIEHKTMPDLASYFDEGDLFIFNNTRVFPARLYATKEKTNARIEVFLLRELSHEMRYWDVLVDPARKIRIGNKLYFGNDDTIVAEVIDNTTSRGRTLRFLTDYDNDEFVERLYALGETPLPKYIKRDWENNETDEEARILRDKEIKELRREDEERYQSIFATEIGAVAAPAACLHFSKNIIKRLEIRGIECEYMTSHMGLGNFKPVDVEDLTKHKVDSEQFIIPESLAKAVDRAHAENHRVCAVGTEIMRALESVAGTQGQVTAINAWTNKFIFPPYDFMVANSFFVNLYMPQSSQLMMVASFAGYDYTMAAYKEAVKEGYRFGDYGDAMLVID